MISNEEVARIRHLFHAEHWNNAGRIVTQSCTAEQLTLLGWGLPLLANNILLKSLLPLVYKPTHAVEVLQIARANSEISGGSCWVPA